MKGRENRIYIFGAHSRAQTLAVYLRVLEPETEIEAFLYDNKERNPEWIGETPVYRLEGGGIQTEPSVGAGNLQTETPAGQTGPHVESSIEAEKRQVECSIRAESLHMEYPIYIGTRGVYHEAIEERLRKLGFQTVYPVTVELDLRLRNQYLERYFAETGRSFVKIEDLEPHPSAAIYVAKSVFDKPLRDMYKPMSYEKVIQAGAAFTFKRLPDASVTDDTGENISEKNRQFCELTALYWLWKHAKEEIVGLVHYRRHFLLPKDWVRRMMENGIDGILPIPLYVGPSVEINFKKRHDERVWDCMMECLKERDEKEYEEAKRFFKGNLYSPCNLLILRRKVLCELCEWLFPILFEVTEREGEKEDGYKNRYPGFLSERLITFFFEKHRERYKVVYADKNFLV